MAVKGTLAQYVNSGRIAIGDVRFKRISIPGLTIDRHHVSVTTKHDTSDVTAANCGKQIGFASLCVVGQSGIYTQVVQMITYKLDQTEIGLATGGVKPDKGRQ